MEILLAISVIINVAIFAAGLYLKESIKNYCEFEKGKKLADYNKDLEEYYERRRKAKMVAELFSRRYNKFDDKYEFEKLNWELALILPKDIVCEITTKLVKGTSRFDAMSVLIMVRERLGVKDGLAPDNIAHSG